MSAEQETKGAAAAAAAAAASAKDSQTKMEVDDAEKKLSAEEEELMEMSNDEIIARTRALDNSLRERKSEIDRLNREITTLRGRIKENEDKVGMGKQLPYLVSTVVELVPDCEAGIEDAINAGVSPAAKSKKKKNPPPPQQGKKKTLKEEREELTCAIVKTSLRQTVYLPVIGLVPASELNPGDLVGVNRDTYLIMDKLPVEYDSRVKAMEVDERPTDTFQDIGGLDKQIQELIEAVVWPMTERKELFDKLHIKPPKGVLLYGPPGTGKTLMARVCAAQTKATFLKLAGTQLVQMYIGDGAKIVRDAFALAKEKGNTIIFIDEIDAVGGKRHGGEENGDREVQRTMLELLNQLDGFTSNENIKVIAATNRPDILDPALVRSGRIDRKIEFPLPTEDARAQILQIHSRKMTVSKDVNYDELARMTPDFNGAQLKAVCVEAGMLALRRDATELQHEDFVEGIAEVQAKKKKSLEYFA